MIDRRRFLGVSASCSAHLAFMAVGASPGLRRFLVPDQQRRIVAQEPFGRLEEVGEGLWALISTPLDGDRTTLCNGGIVAGSDGAIVVESFASPDGAAWMARQTRELTGRWPSHALITHYHGDHTGGLTGFGADVGSPRIHSTAVTRELVGDGNAERAPVLADATIVNPTSPTAIDLGGRTVRIVPRQGHTPSDVTLELDDPSVVYCGDLVWNRMFPNYRDAIPSSLSRDVRALRRDRPTTYVSGHGPIADGPDLDLYIQVIDEVEAGARRAIERGVPAAEAAAEFRLSDSLGEWILFNPRYFEVAFGAWEKELA